MNKYLKLNDGRVIEVPAHGLQTAMAINPGATEVYQKSDGTGWYVPLVNTPYSSNVVTPKKEIGIESPAPTVDPQLVGINKTDTFTENLMAEKERITKRYGEDISLFERAGAAFVAAGAEKVAGFARAFGDEGNETASRYYNSANYLRKLYGIDHNDVIAKISGGDYLGAASDIIISGAGSLPDTAATMAIMASGLGGIGVASKSAIILGYLSKGLAAANLFIPSYGNKLNQLENDPSMAGLSNIQKQTSAFAAATYNTATEMLGDVVGLGIIDKLPAKTSRYAAKKAIAGEVKKSLLARIGTEALKSGAGGASEALEAPVQNMSEMLTDNALGISNYSAGDIAYATGNAMISSFATGGILASSMHHLSTNSKQSGAYAERLHNALSNAAVLKQAGYDVMANEIISNYEAAATHDLYDGLTHKQVVNLEETLNNVKNIGKDESTEINNGELVFQDAYNKYIDYAMKMDESRGTKNKTYTENEKNQLRSDALALLPLAPKDMAEVYSKELLGEKYTEQELVNAFNPALIGADGIENWFSLINSNISSVQEPDNNGIEVSAKAIDEIKNKHLSLTKNEPVTAIPATNNQDNSGDVTIPSLKRLQAYDGALYLAGNNTDMSRESFGYKLGDIKGEDLETPTDVLVEDNLLEEISQTPDIGPRIDNLIDKAPEVAADILNSIEDAIITRLSSNDSVPDNIINLDSIVYEKMEKAQAAQKQVMKDHQNQAIRDNADEAYKKQTPVQNNEEEGSGSVKQTKSANEAQAPEPKDNLPKKASKAKKISKKQRGTSKQKTAMRAMERQASNIITRPVAQNVELPKVEMVKTIGGKTTIRINGVVHESKTSGLKINGSKLIYDMSVDSEGKKVGVSSIVRFLQETSPVFIMPRAEGQIPKKIAGAYFPAIDSIRLWSPHNGVVIGHEYGHHMYNIIKRMGGLGGAELSDLSSLLESFSMLPGSTATVPRDENGKAVSGNADEGFADWATKYLNGVTEIQLRKNKDEEGIESETVAPFLDMNLSKKIIEVLAKVKAGNTEYSIADAWNDARLAMTVHNARSLMAKETSKTADIRLNKNYNAGVIRSLKRAARSVGRLVNEAETFGSELDIVRGVVNNSSQMTKKAKELTLKYLSSFEQKFTDHYHVFTMSVGQANKAITTANYGIKIHDDEGRLIPLYNKSYSQIKNEIFGDNEEEWARADFYAKCKSALSLKEAKDKKEESYDLPYPIDSMKEVVSRGDKVKKYVQYAKEMEQYFDAIAQIGVYGQYITEEEYTKIKESREHYYPLNRNLKDEFEEDERRYGRNNSAGNFGLLKSKQGGDYAFADTDEVIKFRVNRAMRDYYLNQFKRMAVDTFSEIAESHTLPLEARYIAAQSIMPLKMVILPNTTKITGKELADIFNKMIEDHLSGKTKLNYDVVDWLSGRTNNFKKRFGPKDVQIDYDITTYTDKEPKAIHLIAYWEGGKQKYAQVKDNNLFRTLSQHKDAAGAQWFKDIFGPSNATLKKLLTRTLLFSFKNMAGDAFTAKTRSESDRLIKNAVPFAETFSGIYAMLHGTVLKDEGIEFMNVAASEADDYFSWSLKNRGTVYENWNKFKRLSKNGLENPFAAGLRPTERIGKSLNFLTTGLLLKPISLAQEVLPLAQMSANIEAAPRINAALEVIRKAQSEGREATDAEIQMAADNATYNWGMQGANASLTKIMGTIGFTRANIIAMYSDFKLAMESPEAMARFGARTALRTIPATMTLWFLNQLIGMATGDSDDYWRRARNRQALDRWTYMDVCGFKLYYPRGILGYPYALTWNMLDYVFGKMHKGDNGDEVNLEIMAGLNRLRQTGMLGINDIMPMGMATILMSTWPNYDWYWNKPIVPTWRADMDISKQRSTYTGPQLYSKISEWLGGNMVGRAISTAVSGKRYASPETLKFITRNIASSDADDIIKLIDLAVGNKVSISSYIKNNKLNVPFVGGALVADPIGYLNKYTQKIYDEKGSIKDDLSVELTRLISDSGVDMEKDATLKDKYSTVIALHARGEISDEDMYIISQQFNEYANLLQTINSIDKINKKIRDLRYSNNPDKWEEINQLQQQISDTAISGWIGYETKKEEE